MSQMSEDLKFNGLNFERIICLCLNTFKYTRFNGPFINDIYELDFSNLIGCSQSYNPFNNKRDVRKNCARKYISPNSFLNER